MDLRDRLLSQPWAINPEYASIYAPAVAAIMEGRDPFPRLKKSEWQQQNATQFIKLDNSGSQDDDEFEDDEENAELIDPDEELEETEDADEPATDGSVALIRLRGPILKYNQFCGPRGTLSIAEELDELRQDGNVIGAILHIESGGGEFYAVKPLTDAIQRFRAEKPLVTLAGDFLCSAAYYIAAFTEEIICQHQKAIVGSIGTMISFPDLQPYFEKMGVKFHEIYASQSTLKNKTANEAKKGNYKPIIDKMLDPINDDFINDVKEQRGKKLANNKTIFQGETFFASVAVQLGMIDQLGDLNDAVARVRQLAAKSSKTPATTNQNSDMSKFKNVEALAGITEATPEQLAQANADLTEAGITNHTIVPESMITEAENTTKALATAQTEVTRLTNELATANQNVTNLTAENATLKQKVEKVPFNGPKQDADPKTEKTAEELTQEEISQLPHNKALDGHPLFG